MGFLDCPSIVTGGAGQAAADPSPLADRQGYIFENAQTAEQRGDLKGANKAALDPRRLWQPGNLGAVEQDLPSARSQRPGYQLHKARLASAVRPNERVARTAIETEID